ncbi:unnamed protein product [Cuscuta campestris]|uniref:Amino acid permease/ SLC12A domain-containing protein n=1 Tax=Cuscuta campestris TaxID=132261 RepID=A0A484KDY0_9ASTE|nr:unnamed protein product [Cuscuta campestris]
MPMGPSSPSSSETLLQGEEEEKQSQSPASGNSRKLALLPLIFLIYFEVAGGPYGAESAVGAAGPLPAILGFLVFPFVWSLPEALVTAELATAFPGNGGFVIWAHKAFGPFWGSMMGSWKLVSGVVNLATYPSLCVDYLKLVFPVFSSGNPRILANFSITLFLSLLNYSGLSIVGSTALCLGLLSLSPFLVLSVISIPRIDPKRWVSLGEEGAPKNWTLFLNTLFWNLNFWDSASTLAGEVENPQRTFPTALFSAGILTCLAYLIPLLATTGSTPLDQAGWTNGHFADVAESVSGGKWLKYWVEVGSVLSAVGLYEAQLSSCAYQILGMAEIGAVPRALDARSERFDTPWVGVVGPTLVALAVSCADFASVVSSVNFLYGLGMLLEFGSFLWLRVKMPDAKRPYKVPLSLPWLVVMCLVPSGFLVYVMADATKAVFGVSALLTLLGVLWYFIMKLCRVKKWVFFYDSEENYCG